MKRVYGLGLFIFSCLLMITNVSAKENLDGIAKKLESEVNKINDASTCYNSKVVKENEKITIQYDVKEDQKSNGGCLEPNGWSFRLESKNDVLTMKSSYYDKVSDKLVNYEELIKQDILWFDELLNILNHKVSFNGLDINQKILKDEQLFYNKRNYFTINSEALKNATTKAAVEAYQEALNMYEKAKAYLEGAKETSEVKKVTGTTDYEYRYTIDKTCTREVESTCTRVSACGKALNDCYSACHDDPQQVECGDACDAKYAGCQREETYTCTKTEEYSCPERVWRTGHCTNEALSENKYSFQASEYKKYDLVNGTTTTQKDDRSFYGVSSISGPNNHSSSSSSSACTWTPNYSYNYTLSYTKSLNQTNLGSSSKNYNLKTANDFNAVVSDTENILKKAEENLNKNLNNHPIAYLADFKFLLADSVSKIKDSYSDSIKIEVNRYTDISEECLNDSCKNSYIQISLDGKDYKNLKYSDIVTSNPNVYRISNLEPNTKYFIRVNSSVYGTQTLEASTKESGVIDNNPNEENNPSKDDTNKGENLGNNTNSSDKKPDVGNKKDPSNKDDIDNPQTGIIIPIGIVLIGIVTLIIIRYKKNSIHKI